MNAPTNPLGYQARIVVPLRRWARRLIMAVIVGVILYIGVRTSPTITRRVWLLYLQGQCAGYRLPPAAVVWDSGPGAMAGSAPASSAYAPAPAARGSATRLVIQPWDKLWTALSGKRPKGFFVGTLVSASGTKRMLGLCCIQYWCADSSYLILEADLLTPGSPLCNPKVAAEDRQVATFIIPSERRVQFSGVRIDPDRRHFQFQFATEDESGTINGHISDDGSLALTATDASGTINSGGSLMKGPMPPVWPWYGNDRKPGPLYEAADRGSLSEVRRILESTAKPDADRSKYGTTALMRAAFHGDVEMMRLLIANGAHVDAEAYDGSSPLQFAGDGGHLAAAALLLEKGADVRHKDWGGRTALYHAVNFGGSHGTTIGGGSLEMARLLVEKGADVNAAISTGVTPLRCAAQKGNAKIVELLIAKGADVNSRDQWGRTALRAARAGAKATGRGEFQVVIELLIARGARENP